MCGVLALEDFVHVSKLSAKIEVVWVRGSNWRPCQKHEKAPLNEKVPLLTFKELK